MKHIILCADDYGQNPSISQAIIDLANKNRISAASCMTNSPYWLNSVQDLISFKDHIDIGLHINFTEGFALSDAFKNRYGEMFSLPSLLMHTFLRQLNPKAIEAEISTQLDYFEKAMNRLPDFIDGHQHVHHFPIIRDAILRVYAKRLKKNGTYIRSVTQHSILNIKNFKNFIIEFSGAKKLKAQLIKQVIPHNSSFSGIYNFTQASQYSIFFPQFLKTIRDGGLIMCHPGLSASSENDPIYRGRSYEYEYFNSDNFLRECEKQQIKITTYSRIKRLKG